MTLPAPAGPGQFFAQDPLLTVQVVNGAGTCWAADFPEPGLKNDASRFKDKVLQ